MKNKEQVVNWVFGILTRRLYRYNAKREITPVFELAVDHHNGVRCAIPYGISDVEALQVSVGDMLSVGYDHSNQVVNVRVKHLAMEPQLEYIYPRVCPVCGTALLVDLSGDTLVAQTDLSRLDGTNEKSIGIKNKCFSSKCHVGSLGRLTSFLAASSIRISYMNKRILHHLVSRGVVVSPADLMTTTYSDIMEMENVFVTPEDAVDFLKCLGKYHNQGVSVFLSMLYGSIAHLVPRTINVDTMHGLFYHVMSLTRNQEMSASEAILLFINMIKDRTLAMHLTNASSYWSVNEQCKLAILLTTYFDIAGNWDALMELFEWYHTPVKKTSTQ